MNQSVLEATSCYEATPINFSDLSTIPLKARGGKVKVEHFATPSRGVVGMQGLLHSLPKILAANTLRALITSMERARSSGKPIIWGLGGHVVKCGLAPILIDLMQRGWATAFAMNGAGSIHDFEIALCGCTSEDVELVLPDGRFGTAQETGYEMNTAIVEGDLSGIGMGEALGRRLQMITSEASAKASLLLQAYTAHTPVTVHVAIGTDTLHVHPEFDAGALGRASHYDFRLFARLVSELDGGGVYINAGSAVVMPEVFLKALSAVRNLGHSVRDFTTVNLDFQQHYRPRMNVLERPHANAGGAGLSLTGHHEIMIPLIAAALNEIDC